METGSGGGRKLRLNNHKAARATLARLLREYDRGELPSQQFRDMVYALDKLLQFFRFEADLKIEERLSALEGRLETVA